MSALRRESYKPLTPCWTKISLFFKELDIDYARILMTEGNGRWGRMNCVIRVVQTRSCSKIGDEALVVAALLTREFGAAKKILPSPQMVRYKRILDEANNFPAEFVFMPTHRYEGYSSRWMPKTLLSQAAPVIGMLQSNCSTDIIHVDFGLTVTLHGFIIHFPSSITVVRKQFHLAHNMFTIFEAGASDHPFNIKTAEQDLGIVLPNCVQYHYSEDGRSLGCCVAALV